MERLPLMHATPTGALVVVLSDADSLALAAATVMVTEARRAVNSSGRVTMALSGGNTPRPIYELLGKPPFVDLVPWEKTHIFWGDERCVDFTDERSNERMARTAFLDAVPIPGSQIHPMRCTDPGSGGSAGRGGGAGGAAPPEYGEEAARRVADKYERLLRDFFGAAPGGKGAPQSGGIDLMLLGIGDNGHTASLFPGSSVLDEQDRWVAAAYEDPTTAAAMRSAGGPLWRVTMTAPFINRSMLTVFVAGGASKAPAVRRALQEESDPHVIPARLVKPASGRLLWLLDEKAASGLTGAPPTGAAAGSPHAERAAVASEYTVVSEHTDAPESFDELEGCELGPSR